MTMGLRAAVCAAALLGASSAQAITFSFDWESVSGTSTSDETMSASGFIQLVDTLGNGDLFDLSHLVALTINVIGDTITNITFDENEPNIILSGAISSDGLSASLFDFFVGTFATPSTTGIGFGCDFEFCGSTTSDEGIVYNIASGRTPEGVLGTTAYASAADALASFTLERYVAPEDPGPSPEVVPLPATAPLLLGGLGALALWRRRQKRAAG